MKLGKLLAAGKSIMNGRAEISYRSSKQIYLPKFGPAKNPFKLEVAEPPAETEPQACGPVPPVEPTVAPRPVRAARAEVSAVRMPPVAPVGPKSGDVVAVTPQKGSKDWSKFNPLTILRGALPSGAVKRADAPAKEHKASATQTELSLDTVKVVHNDLSDVDVEVVPIKSRTGEPQLPAPKKSWEYVGERLFGVEAT